MMNITRIGIDLGKSWFQVCAMDRHDRVVLERKLNRRRLERFLSELAPCTVAMEACGGAHHWARLAQSHGHRARLVSPQFVKPYVKSNKNDARDAQAICEAAGRPTMRFAPMKTVEQQALQHEHRVRAMAVSNRTALANQMRGMLLEYGIVVAQGLGVLRRRVVEVLEDTDNGLVGSIREVLAEQLEALRHLDERVRTYDRRLGEAARETPACRRLMTRPGFGAMNATALVAAVGDGSAFASGREVAAWVGVVARQRSTGGRTTLLGISKRGDRSLRALLIHGARAALRTAPRRDDARARWAQEVARRRGTHVAVVALVNKMLRSAWAMLVSGAVYDGNAGVAPRG